MTKFEKGDRVVRTQITNARNVLVGSTGVVVSEDDGWGLVCVCWDEIPPHRGHTCGGLCEDGHGWDVPPEDLDHISSIQIDEGEYDAVDIKSMLGSFVMSE